VLAAASSSAAATGDADSAGLGGRVGDRLGRRGHRVVDDRLGDRVGRGVGRALGRTGCGGPGDGLRPPRYRPARTRCGGGRLGLADGRLLALSGSSTSSITRIGALSPLRLPIFVDPV
jgi:hypothetical protein